MRSLMLAAALATLATSAMAEPVKNKADAAVKFLFENRTPADARALHKREPTSAFARCIIFVSGSVLSDGDCNITGHRDAPTFETASGFFGGLGEGMGYWNGEPESRRADGLFPAPKAHTPLNDMRKVGQCWMARSVTICISP